MISLLQQNDHTFKCAEIIKALGHPLRLQLITLLKGDEMCVQNLAIELKVDSTTISQHLKILRMMRIVEVDRKGRYSLYRISMPCIYNVVEFLEQKAWS